MRERTAVLRQIPFLQGAGEEVLDQLAQGEVRLEEMVTEMRPGDQLVLYSDGITDAHSPEGDLFGLERLRRIVCANGDLGAQALCDTIFEQVDRFQDEARQYDDAALLVVRMGDG